MRYAATALPSSQRKNGTLSLTVPGASNRWTLLCVDMAAAARAASGCAFTALRGIQICSTMSMRGVFTSDIKFTIKVGFFGQFAGWGYVDIAAG